MLNYNHVFYFFISIIFITSVTSIQGCHITTITYVAESNATTEVPGISCALLTPNDYVDELISKLKNKTTDTIPLPDDPGFTSFKEGLVWGLSTLKRVGNAVMKCNETMTTVEVLLSFEELKGRYKWEKKVIKKFSGVVFIKADTADILFRVSQQHGNDTGITLDELCVKNLSDIHTDITGLGVVTWAVSAITEPAANMFKKSMAKMVEGPLKEAIGLALKDINIPLH